MKPNPYLCRRSLLLSLLNLGATAILRAFRSPNHPLPVEWALKLAEFCLGFPFWLPPRTERLLHPVLSLAWVTFSALLWGMLIEVILQRHVDQPKDSGPL